MNKLKYTEVLEDFTRLIDEYGFPYDWTGVIQTDNVEVSMFITPTKANAAKHMKNIILYGFQFGACWRTEEDRFYIEDDVFLNACYEKYEYE